MENWLNRTELLIGKESLQKLQASTVVVFGCGGVGSYVIEGLVRSGIGHLVVVDNDIVDVTEITIFYSEYAGEYDRMKNEIEIKGNLYRPYTIEVIVAEI